MAVADGSWSEGSEGSGAASGDHALTAITVVNPLRSRSPDLRQIVPHLRQIVPHLRQIVPICLLLQSICDWNYLWISAL